jgi:Zn-dependent metalloprotease
MKPNLDDLVLKAVLEPCMEVVSFGVFHLDFKQTYKGLPVWGGEYFVHIGSDGMIRMVNGNYYPNIQAHIIPNISESEAMSIAVNHIGISGDLRAPTSSELVIYPLPESFTLAYRLFIPTVNPFGSWEVFVDAMNGSVIAFQDMILHACSEPLDKPYTTGTGQVYKIDPANSSLTKETLKYLRFPGYTLSGKYVTVYNDAGDEAYSESKYFVYIPPTTQNPYSKEQDNTHFDEVNIYYHITKYVDEYLNKYLNNYNNISLLSLKAKVHVDQYDNASYDPPPLDQFRFGWGTMTHLTTYIRDTAKENDVIYHEVTHKATVGMGLWTNSNYLETILLL